MNDAAREKSLRERDARARRRAQEWFDHPLVLEAGAGTGKTTALVGRIAAWCLGPGWERHAARLGARGAAPGERVAREVLDRVVAITFTEAAAAEMGDRVGEALHEIAQGREPVGVLVDLLPPDAERRARATALLGALDRLVTQTIHAWCRRLLLRHPLEAQLHPRLEVDPDQRLQQEVVREVLEEHLREAYLDAADSTLLRLAERGFGPQELEVELLALLEAGLPASAFEEDPFAPARVAALGERLRGAARDVCDAWGDALAGLRRSTKAEECIAAAARLAGRLEDHPPATRDDLRELAQQTADAFGPVYAKLRDWGTGRFGKGESDALGERQEAVAGAAARLQALVTNVRAIDVDVLDLGRSAVGDLLGRVEDALRSRGVATFSDLLEEARALLRDQPAVAERERARIDQLLVDEFQDTDRRQCDLVAALALGGPRERRPGLFVVGDPKQSIYGWRSADLTAYEGFRDRVCAEGGELERLSVSYRSVPAVLDEVERALRPVMRERPGVQPPFEPLVPSEARRAAPGYARGAHAPVEYWVCGAWDAEADAPDPVSSAEASHIEARALARDLRALHEGGVAWGACAVLFRSRTDWDLYLGALRDADVPFSVEGDRSYYRRREIVDAAGLVRCVADSNDHVALLTLLRCAAVGVPDAALVPLWAHELPRLAGGLHDAEAEALAALRDCVRAAAAELPAGVPGLERVAGWEENLIAALETLGALRRALREDPVDVFVEKLRTGFLLEASEAARYQGAWRIANLDRFFRELIDDLDEEGSLHGVLRRLRAAVAEERDAEEARPRELLDDAVQILTVHGAKGLDFGHVYAVQLHKGRGGVRREKVEFGSADGRLEYRVLNAPTLGWDRVEAERQARDEAERVRLLYVAMTRAKERLVVSGAWPDFLLRQGPGRPVDLLAGHRAKGIDLADTLARRARAEPYLDTAQARWKFAQPGEPEVAGRRDEAVPASAPADERALAREAAASRRLREEARARMRRPLSRAASSGPGEDREEGEDRLERRLGAGGEDEGARPQAQGRGGEVARAVGTALHRALEHFDLDADPVQEHAAARGRVERALAAELSGARLARARERAAALLERFAAGPLCARLRELAPYIVARELPVLLAAGADDDATDVVAGSLDLVYRDPAGGELVIADYKTGAPRDHARQGAAYRRALREALGLSYEPRFELWYLDAGRIDSV